MLKVVGASWKKIQVSTWIIGAVLVLGIVVIILGEVGHYDEDGNWAATVYWSKESGFETVFWGQGRKIENIPKGVARAYYKLHLNTTGWAVLDIETQPGHPDWVQAFGAGILEGSLTWQMIDWQRQNTINRVCEDNEQLCDEIKDYLLENFKWIKQKYKNSMGSYWYQMRMFYLQLEGLQKGFEQGVKRSRAHHVEDMAFEDFLWLNAIDDIDDLQYKFSGEDLTRKTFGDIRNSSRARKFERKRSIKEYSLNKQGRQDLIKSRESADDDDEKQCKCGHGQLSMASAFVKLVEDDAKLYVGHNSAGHYSSMLKMLKHYRFAYRRSKDDPRPLTERRLVFSSYPGVIHSVDDFYVVKDDETDVKLIVTGISIPVFKESLWLIVSPVGQVLIGPRVMAANRLAANGKEWVDILRKYNSGTGNKEWVVADFAKFEAIARMREESEEAYRKGLKEAEGLLWVAEQIPGFFEAADKTESLRSASYWASYGLPFFKNVSAISGLDTVAEESGWDVYSYEEAPVAKMFRRDGVNATDMESVARLMRSNSYETDPFSHGNPRCAIGSRGDLGSEAQEAEPVGVTDTKVFSSRDVSSRKHKIGARNKYLNVTDVLGEEGRELRIRAGPPYSDTWNVLNRTTAEGHAMTRDNHLRPFNWAESEFVDVPHFGHPDVWDFEPLVVF